MLFWLLGDLSGAEHPLAPWFAAAIVVAAAQVLAPRLDALALGTLKARSLGVPVGATQTVAFLAATVATVAAVLVAGSIGFVGLVVPHALRLAGLGDHRRLLPLFGPCRRHAAHRRGHARAERRRAARVPGRAITALVGVPVLLALLARELTMTEALTWEHEGLVKEPPLRPVFRCSAAGLTLAVPGRTLVSGFDLRLAPGDCCAVLGRNGAGKTSLLLALAGLRTPESGRGEARRRADRLGLRRELARRVGILLQDETESFWGTTLEYAAARPGRARAGALRRRSVRRAAARAALAEVDLATHADQPYRTLSGGERQRARIAQLLVQSPKRGSSTSRSPTSTSATRRRRCGLRRASPQRAAR